MQAATTAARRRGKGDREKRVVFGCIVEGENGGKQRVKSVL
jgi:hypothetical protein